MRDIEHAAIRAHRADSREIDIGKHPARLIEHALRDDPVIGKTAIGRTIDCRRAAIDIDRR